MGSWFSIEFSFLHLGLDEFRSKFPGVTKEISKNRYSQAAASSGPLWFNRRQPLRRGMELTLDASDGVAGDQELFVRWDYKSMQTGIIRADLAF
jgi:hypothetical protein